MQIVRNIGLVSWVLWLTLVLTGFGPAWNQSCHGQSAAACTCCCPFPSDPATPAADPIAAHPCSAATCASTGTTTVASVKTTVAPTSDTERDPAPAVRIYQQWLLHYLVDAHQPSTRRQNAYASVPFRRDVFLRLCVLLI